MAYERPTAVEIDKKLREDFRTRLKDFGISQETPDPILAVLFRTFSGQLESLYAATGQIRLALLDELIAGLGIEPRRGRSAQTVVRFLSEAGPQLVEAGTELIGEAQSGERLTFTTDAAITVSPARIALALTYQDGQLQLLPGVELPDAMQSARPSLEPVRVNLGGNPAIFLAIENLPAHHLSRHGFFFELGPDAAPIQRALQTETWCLAGSGGEMGAQGILRPRRVNGGTRALQWLVPERERSLEHAPDAETPSLPDGFYAGRVLVFPEVPPARRFLCRRPRAMESALDRIFGRTSSEALAAERAWLRITMPKQSPPLHIAISSLSLHAVTASNAGCFNETIRFDEQGASVPVSREAGADKHLVAPLSIFGEAGDRYLPQFEPSADLHVGRYGIHNGRLEFTPARYGDNRVDSYANVRLWLTSGSLGNAVGPGQIQSFLKRGSAPAVRIVNPTAAAGGADGESFQQAQQRFAAALLSRDRIVTRTDLETVVRAFDRRLRDVEVKLAVERTPQGLARVHKVRCRLDREELLDPERERAVLREELARHLETRCLYGVGLSLEVEWA